MALNRGRRNFEGVFRKTLEDRQLLKRPAAADWLETRPPQRLAQVASACGCPKNGVRTTLTVIAGGRMLTGGAASVGKGAHDS
jgi:hypothetical protein